MSHEKQPQQATMLVVEDEERSRRLLEAMLTSLGYACRTAADGREALDVIGPDIDLVLSDVMMPRMNGFEFVKELRRLPRYAELPVIMTTALSGKEDRLTAVEAGANDFVSKPLDRLELKIRIASLLKIKHAQDARKQMLRDTVKGSVQMLADVLAVLKPDVYGRVARRAPLIRRTARLVGDPSPWFTETAALLNSLGSVVLAEELLRRMTEQNELLDDNKLHSEQTMLSVQMVSRIPRLEPVAEIIAYAEKGYDGSGQPRDDDRKGDDLPLGSRVIRAVTDYDHHRAGGLKALEALAKLKEHPAPYDPAVLEALRKALGEISTLVEVQVPITELVDGMIMAHDLFVEMNGKPEKLMMKGQEVNAAVREYLSSYHRHTPIKGLIRVLAPNDGEDDLRQSA